MSDSAGSRPESSEVKMMAQMARRAPASATDVVLAGTILLLGVFLAAAGGSIVRRWQASSARQQSLGFEEQLGIVANTAGLIVIVWWALSFVVAVAAALLDRSGRVRAASAAGKFAPGFMRRLVMAAVGMQLLTAPLASASAQPSVPGTAAATSSASVAWTPEPVPGTAGTALPRIDPGPAMPPAPGMRAVPNPQWRPLRPAVEPGPLAGRPLRDRQPTGEAAEATVRPGDSLWSLSAARLGPYASDVDIALDWPRLYQANRDIIGGNPNLLRPGQVLRLPPAP